MSPLQSSLSVAQILAIAMTTELPEWVIKLRLSAWWNQQLNEIPSLSTMPIDLIRLISGYARSSIIVAFGRESPYDPHKSVIAISVDEPEPIGWVTLPHIRSCTRYSLTCFTINDTVYATMGVPQVPSASYQIWNGPMDRLSIDDYPMGGSPSPKPSTPSTPSATSLSTIDNSIRRSTGGHDPFQWYQHTKQSRSSSGRLYSGHLTMNDQWYLISGESLNPDSSYRRRSDIEQYDPIHDEYTPNAIPPLIHECNLPSAAKCGDYIYVMGDIGPGIGQFIVQRYHIPTRQWLTFPSFTNDPNLPRVSSYFSSSIITVPRCHQCMPTSNATELILIMGSNEKEVIVYDPSVYNASSHGYVMILFSCSFPVAAHSLDDCLSSYH
jgi:hypothetical protein